MMSAVHLMYREESLSSGLAAWLAMGIPSAGIIGALPGFSMGFGNQNLDLCALQQTFYRLGRLTSPNFELHTSTSYVGS